MPRKSKLKLPPLDLGKESLGERFARIRKEKGYTQVELADKIGIIQGLVSDYERDKIRPHPEMVVRFAQALTVSTDELLGLKPSENNNDKKPNMGILRRLKKIETLPSRQQKTLLQTIDTFLKGAQR